MRVEVVWSAAPRTVQALTLELPPGATVGDALLASGLVDTGDCGIWGQRVPRDQPLHEGDRVELYRALTVDPMEARRRRQQAQKDKRPARAGR